MTSGRSVTPEAVQLRTDVAGLGSRFIALVVDGMIQALVLIPVFIGFVSGGLVGTVEAVAFAILLFAVLWLYYPLFEWLWSGRTPGKRTQGIRVVRTNGQPVGFAPVAVRNLVRIVDVFLLPFLAVAFMFTTARAQRLGDLAAGTMVVRDRRIPAPQVLSLGGDQEADAALDTTRLSEGDYTLIRTFLGRRESLDAAARAQLAARLAASVRKQLGQHPEQSTLSDEQLLQAVARAYRARFSRR